ncbi:hypothetical protein K7432_012824 [Basidiobolus ranarum]|uniref:Uncharacterized protein n=1 Tax=Basidiobolus ranarum TaxID=34480 RepID=A0ABR2WKB6_9FUNG
MATVSNYVPPARFNTASPFEGPLRFVDRLRHDPVLQIMADIGKQSQSETRKPVKNSGYRFRSSELKSRRFEQTTIRQATAREQVISQFRRPDTPLKPSLSLAASNLSEDSEKLSL